MGLHYGASALLVRGFNWYNEASKQMAKDCGHVNPTRNTAQGRRASFISNVSEAEGLGAGLQRRLNRHKRLDTSAGYHRPSGNAIDKGITAVQGWNVGDMGKKKNDAGKKKNDEVSVCSPISIDDNLTVVNDVISIDGDENVGNVGKMTHDDMEEEEETKPRSYPRVINFNTSSISSHAGPTASLTHNSNLFASSNVASSNNAAPVPSFGPSAVPSYGSNYCGNGQQQIMQQQQ